MTGTEGSARYLVQEVLGQEDAAVLGIVTCPDGRQDACRRARTPGEFVWRPLHEDPSSYAAAKAKGERAAG
jgi:hypothetical protein